MSVVLPPAHAAEDPLGDISVQVHQQVADAVATVIRTSPDCLPRQRLHTMPKLDRVFLDQPVSGPSDEIVGDWHQAVFASVAARISRKTSSASSTFPNGADTC